MPLPGQYWSDAGSIGPVLAHYGMFMGQSLRVADMNTNMTFILCEYCGKNSVFAACMQIKRVKVNS